MDLSYVFVASSNPEYSPSSGSLKPSLITKDGVGVVDQVILGDAIVFDRVVNEAAQEGDVGAGPNLQKQIGGGCGAGEARINDDQLGVAVLVWLRWPT